MVELEEHPFIQSVPENDFHVSDLTIFILHFKQDTIEKPFAYVLAYDRIEKAYK